MGKMENQIESKYGESTGNCLEIRIYSYCHDKQAVV